MNEECGNALNDSSKIGGSIMLAVPSPRSSLRDLAGTRVFSPPSTIVHSRWTGPMPMESAFLPSQSAFPGLPPREEIVEVCGHCQDRNTANMIGLAVLAAFHLPNTATPSR